MGTATRITTDDARTADDAPIRPTATFAEMVDAMS